MFHGFDVFGQVPWIFGWWICPSWINRCPPHCTKFGIRFKGNLEEKMQQPACDFSLQSSPWHAQRCKNRQVANWCLSWYVYNPTKPRVDKDFKTENVQVENFQTSPIRTSNWLSACISAYLGLEAKSWLLHHLTGLPGHGTFPREISHSRGSWYCWTRRGNCFCGAPQHRAQRGIRILTMKRDAPRMARS